MLSNLAKRAARCPAMPPRGFTVALPCRGPATGLSFHDRSFFTADPCRAQQQSMDLSLPANWQQVWVLGLTESAQQLMKEGRYAEACEKMQEAARVAEKFQICVDVQQEEGGPVTRAPLADLCAEALDSTAAWRPRRNRRGRRTVSDEQLRNMVAMTDKVSRGLEQSLAQ
jgi:hypothetical protein